MPPENVNISKDPWVDSLICMINAHIKLIFVKI